MTTTLDDVINSLPPERREKIEHLTVELVEEVATLRELRKKQKLTQADIAQLLGIKQENVSRLERRNNIHLSTLKDYIHALGGKLHLIVEFPNQEPIKIKDIENVETTELEPIS
ncbi:MAG: helix-turn-helix domain-containing protein [Xenococcus sp. (in: cyanobacteria)]